MTEENAKIDLSPYWAAKAEYEEADQAYKQELKEATERLRELYHIESLRAEAEEQRATVVQSASFIHRVDGLKTIPAMGGTVVVAVGSKLELDEPVVIEYLREAYPELADNLIKQSIERRPFTKWRKAQLAVGVEVPGVEETERLSIRIKAT